VKKINKNSSLSFFKNTSNIAWYVAIGISIITFFILVMTFIYPEYAQDKISVPVEFSIKNTNHITLSNDLNKNSDLFTLIAADITYGSKDLFIIRGYLFYTFIIFVGICFALFFWRKIFNSIEHSRFFSKENRSMVNFFGWLLIVYSFLFGLINFFFKTFINYRMHKSPLLSSFGENPSINIFLIIFGFLFILISKIADQRESK